MSSPIGVYGVEHVGVLARDTEALATWYKETFGATEVSRGTDTPAVIFLRFGGGALLELVPAADSPAVAPSDHVHVCFSVRDIEAAARGLRECGVELERPIFTVYEGSRVAFFRDPEGNLLQLAQRVADSRIDAAVYDIGR